MIESDWFYYSQDGETFGPLTLEQMIERACAGALKSRAVVCRAGEEEWSAVSSHAILGDKLSPPIAMSCRKSKLQAALDTLLIATPEQREVLIERLSKVKVLYRSADENHKGSVSLWQVLDLIDAGVLPLETQVCVEGSEYWRDAVMVCAGRS